MSAVELVLAILAADAGLAALAAADAIKGGEIPQNIAPPALCANTISIVDVPSLAGTSLSVSRVQVTIYAADYAGQVDLLGRVRDALKNKRVNAGGVPGASLRLDGAGPDFRDVDASLWLQTQDVRVSIPA